MTLKKVLGTVLACTLLTCLVAPVDAAEVKADAEVTVKKEANAEQVLSKKELKARKKMELNKIPPSDAFIKSIADKYNLPYTMGKGGVERFYSDDDRAIYPPNDGNVGKPKIKKLKAGMLLDRYGSEFGRFMSPKGEPWTKRALPKFSAPGKVAYHVYEVVTPFKVKAGKAAPWFGEKGGCLQFELEKSVLECIKENLLKRVE
ncbi:MAG: TNT domain-containing protein [Phascolarctobacterium sp.]|nr:TNT domain-containing protein [Phascolarctobacterium sp.]